MNRRPSIALIAPSASPVEAAAVAAALERFMRDTAPPVAASAPAPNAWRRTALLEGVGAEIQEIGAWGDPHPWGAG